MKYKRPTLDKWYFRLNIRKDYVRNNGYIFTFGLFKLKSLAPEGCMISKQNYKGFLIMYRISQL